MFQGFIQEMTAYKTKYVSRIYMGNDSIQKLNMFQGFIQEMTAYKIKYVSRIYTGNDSIQN